MSRKVTFALVGAAIVFILWYYLIGGSSLLAKFMSEHYAAKFISALLLFAGVTVIYMLVSLLIKSAMLKAGAKEGGGLQAGRL